MMMSFVRHNKGDRIVTTHYVKDENGKWIEMFEIDDIRGDKEK